MKPNLYQNGILHKRQTQVIPKGFKLIPVEKYRLWLTVPKKWTNKQCETHREAWLKSYETILIHLISDTV
jgi:hypothetical protein